MIIARFLNEYSEWFRFDYKTGEYIPLEGAPQEALDLYNSYIETKKRMKEKKLR